MLRWFLRILLVLVLLPFVGAGLYAGWNWLQLRPDAKFVTYLEQNASIVDLASDQPFAITEVDLGARLILLGEVHGIKIGQDLDFELLRMLNAKKDVRYYLGEFDPAQAAAFNAYLVSGDETHLRRVFAFWVDQNAQWANQEFMDKIRKVRALNDTLPPERKIRFIGMDRVQDMPLMAEHLEGLLAVVPENSWPGQTAFVFAVADESARAENTATSPIPLAAAEAAKTFPEITPEGIDAANWNALRESIWNLSDRALLKGREAGITAAFERLADDPGFSGESFYGFWGQFHVLNATVQGNKPFVRQLQEGNSAFAGNIVSLNIINLDSSMMLPASSFGSDEPYIEIPYSLDNPLMVFVNGINDAKTASLAPLTLFKLNEEGSPYPGTNKFGAVGGILGMLQPFVVDAESVGENAASQYMLLANGSAAVTALSDADIKLD